MQFTEYFRHARAKPDRARIRLERIEQVVNNPIRRELQMDGRIGLWGYIEEEGRFLRVILLDDSRTVHNAFFDRGFRENP